MQSTKYILENVCEQKNLRVFAQNLFKHVKTVEMTSTYNQLCVT